ncbi:MAG TPA: hypothetical protein VL092_07965 [Chitinophagaceae bacterium]|nr:hypothetical protein [Chitinophagaceae bacterium]
MRLRDRAALLLLAAATALNAAACDVCGGGGSIQGLGLLPQFSGHFAGLQWLHSATSSRHPSLFSGKPDEESGQQYTSVQAWGRYQLNKHIQLVGILPYISNQNRDPLLSTQSGIGDAVLLANVSIPLDGKAGTRNKLLLIGAGVKLPTGHYKSAGTEGIPSLQTGTGSWDFTGNLNYTRRHGRWGYNADLSYLFTTANRERYKFGNRLSASGLAFYQLNVRSLRILPQAGLRAEYSLHDYDDYGKKWLNEQSGGTVAFASAGVQIYFRKIGLRTLVSLPFYQHLSAGYVHTTARMEAGIFILF